jgi:hypothetical protein
LTAEAEEKKESGIRLQESGIRIQASGFRFQVKTKLNNFPSLRPDS